MHSKMRKTRSRMLSALFILAMALLIALLVAESAAAAPYFDPRPPYVFNLTQDQAFYYDINATSPENLTIMYSDDSRSPGLGFNVFYMDNTTGVVSFTPTNSYVGFFDVAISIKDNETIDPISISVKFNISNLNDPPNISDYNPKPLNQEISENETEIFGFNYTATDPDIGLPGVVENLSSRWFVDGSLQANYTNRTIFNFTADYCSPRTRNVSLIVSDLNGSTDSKLWNISILDVNRPPLFNWSTPIPNMVSPEGVPLTNHISLDAYFSDPDDECGEDTATYTASGYDGDEVIINISSEEGHYVSFYPQQYWYGELWINFTRSDGEDSATSNNFLLNITNTPTPPVVQNITRQTLYAYAPFLLQVNATSPDLKTLNYADNTSLFEIDGLSGLISFTPDSSVLGNYSISINVSDVAFPGEDVQSAVVVFEMEIINNTPPVILPIGDQYGMQESLFIIEINGTDLEGDNISFSADYSGLGSPTYLNSSSARFQFTPHWEDVGLNVINITATDIRGASSSQSFALNVSYVGMAPTFNETLTYVPAKIDRHVEIQLNGSDLNKDGFNFTSNSTPEGFPHFSLSNGGLITIDANSTEEGNYSINLTITDDSVGHLSSSMVVVFEVTYNRNPYISPIPPQTASEDEPFYLLVNATDLDGDPLVFSTNSSFNFSSEGVFSFTPNRSMVGLHNISVNVSDGDSGWHSTSFLLDISEVNHAPYFEPPLEDYGIWESIFEESLVEIFVNATDDEDDDLNFSSRFISGDSLFEIVKIGRDQALINFTTLVGDEGNYSVEINVSDGELSSLVVINFTVWHLNHAPEIGEIYPYGTPFSDNTVLGWENISEFAEGKTLINATENTTLLFNHTSYDEDNDTLGYSWYLDGTVLSTNSSWSYYMNFTSSGVHNVTLVVSDGLLEDSFYWNLSVANVKRLPVFGKKTQSAYGDFAEGDTTNIVVSQSGLSLEYDLGEGSYEAEGIFVSSPISMGSDFRFADISWVAVVPANTTLSISTSTSDNSEGGWGAWSSATPISDSGQVPINSSIEGYIRYMLNFTTIDGISSPSVSEVVINYVIENVTEVENYYTIENSSSSYWLDLDYFFYDPDGGALNYSLVNTEESIVDVWIESWNGNHVGLRSERDGESVVWFTATDSVGNNVSSNNVTLIFTNDPGSQTRRSSGGTRIKTVYQEIPRDVNKFVNLQIVVPEAMTTYQNSTIVTPIKLVNTGDRPLIDISLSAETNVSGVKLEITQKYFASLGVGEEERTDLIISSPDFLGSYEVTVNADVKDPEFRDYAKIIMNSLEKGELNKSQLDTKITFTKDLLLANPECLELNEMLEQAQYEMNMSNYAEANDMIETTIRECRSLLASKETMQENPTMLQRLYDKIFGLTSKRQVVIFGSVVVGVFMLLTLSLVVERIRRRAKFRLARKKEHKAEKAAEDNIN